METQVVRITTNSTTFQFVRSWLESIGLTLNNPVTGEISGYLTDKGKIIYTEEEFANYLEKNKGTVQFWYSSESDIFLSWDNNEVTLYFDGVEFEVRKKVLLCFMEKFIAPYHSGDMLGWKLSTEFYQ